MADRDAMAPYRILSSIFIKHLILAVSVLCFDREIE